jgi:hypothetical protein
LRFTLVDGNVGGGESRRATGSGLGRLNGKLSVSRNDHRVAQSDPKPGRNAQLWRNGVGLPRLQNRQRSDSERDKQSDHRDDRQPREPIPHRCRTRSDLNTIPLEQMSSQPCF